MIICHGTASETKESEAIILGEEGENPVVLCPNRHVISKKDKNVSWDSVIIRCEATEGDEE